MECEQFDGTPQNTHQSTTASLCSLWAQNIKSGDSVGLSPIRSNASHRKPLHPRTPNNNVSQSSASTSCSSSFHIFPNAVINTPPAKRFQRVRNPFEAALTDRLHLPLIASPSLFQRPATPPLSSTQFEWTIEEVSSMRPAQLEPHETQFHDSPDPDYEAKAQSAISSYFKEQQIVPSPVDCPLRSHRIMLSEMNGDTPISKPGRRIRDCGTQTELTLPAVLPQALEDALRPYFQPQLAEKLPDNESTTTYRFSSCGSNMSNSSSGGGDFKDTSLRRKLFDMHNIIVLDGCGGEYGKASATIGRSLNSSPLSFGGPVQRTAIVGKLSDSMEDKSSFGSLSPISASDGCSISPLSPQGSGKRKSHLEHFLNLSEAEPLSPIQPPVRSRRKSLKNAIKVVQVASGEQYRSTANVSEQTFGELNDCGDKFTPDRSSSPLSHCLETADRTDSSFNNKVSRLFVQATASNSAKQCKLERNLQDDDTADMLDDVDVDDEEMQVSQLSAQSSSCSSASNSDTPRGKRRSASRKNLSQSFSAVNWLDDDENDDADVEQEYQAALTQQPMTRQPLSKLDVLLPTAATTKNVLPNVACMPKQISPEQRLLFYRTDSGFNEMTSSQTTQPDEESCIVGNGVTKKAPEEQDLSMVCCSTPSRRASIAF